MERHLRKVAMDFPSSRNIFPLRLESKYSNPTSWPSVRANRTELIGMWQPCDPASQYHLTSRTQLTTIYAYIFQFDTFWRIIYCWSTQETFTFTYTRIRLQVSVPSSLTLAALPWHLGVLLTTDPPLTFARSHNVRYCVSVYRSVCGSSSDCPQAITIAAADIATPYYYTTEYLVVP